MRQGALACNNLVQHIIKKQQGDKKILSDKRHVARFIDPKETIAQVKYNDNSVTKALNKDVTASYDNKKYISEEEKTKCYW